ncbi:MAG: hypothetical protein ACRDSN_01170 [Pseudonocardiaceae bacterium]
MSYDGAGSLFALGLRLTKLDAAGAPLPGVNNCYVTDALVRVGIGSNYSEIDAVEQANGSGVPCVYFKPPDTVLSAQIDEMVVCTPDPIILAFATGGSTIAGPNEVQTVTITGSPTGGTFTLTYSTQTTGAVAYNATASTVQAALEALSNIAPGDVTAAGGPLPGTAVTVTFTGALAGTDVTQMTASSAGLTGGTTPTVTVTTTTAGGGATTLGYRAPPVNVDPTPNGIGLEAFSRAIRNNAPDPVRPYFHWVLPRVRLRPDEATVLGAENAATPQLTGTGEENAGFGDGPVGDITFPTDRCWQYMRVATIPTLTAGFVTVV